MPSVTRPFDSRSAALESASTGTVILRLSHQPSAPATIRPPINASESRSMSVNQLARSFDTGEATTIAPKVEWPSCTGAAAA